MKNPVAAARLAALPLALAAIAPACLAQPAPTLPEVQVRATRFVEAADSLPIGVSVVTADEIRASGAATVNEALMRVLGVVGRQDFFGAGDFSLDLRGFGSTADQNQLVILDGQRLTEADLQGPRLAVIPIEAVERIEVLRGSGAVLYGEGATGGVIVITTKAGAGRDRVNAASLQAGAGSFGLRDYRADATIAANGFSFDVSGQKRASDNHREHFHAENEALAVTGQWANEWLRVGARHSRDDLDAQLPGALTLAEFAADPRQSTPAQRSDSHLRGERNGVFASARLGAWQVEADAATRSRTVRSQFAAGQSDSDVDASHQSLRARGEIAAGTLRHIVVAGYDHAKWRRDNLFVDPDFGPFPSQAHQDASAFYFKDDLVFPGGTRLSAGARTERIRKQDTAAPSQLRDRQRAWELGASHPLAQGWTAYGRVGRSFRLPAVDEFSGTVPGVSLRPQVSRDVELGLRHSAPGRKAEVRAFRNTLTDEIGFDLSAPDTFGFGANVNFDATRRQGLELDAEQAVGRSLKLRLNAAVREATFRGGPHAGRDVPLVPRRTLALRAEWKPLAHHRVSGGVQWVGKQFADLDNQFRIPSYAVTDLRYAYQWDRFEFALAVGNVLDRKYYSLGFVRRADNVLTVYPEPGRNYQVSVKAFF